MSTNDIEFRPGILLAPLTLVHEPGALERCNAQLAESGRGRLLGPARAITPFLAAVSVDDDPAAVLEALRQKGSADGYTLDYVYRAATFGDRVPRVMYGMGCKIGHALAAWTPVEQALPPAPWRPASQVPGGRPVVALLDNGIAPHPWLATPEVDDPLWTDAPGWEAGGSASTGIHVGSHAGHGTFIAGLIRQFAPDARILSLRVMDEDGQVCESTAIQAVEWLIQQCHQGHRVDVLCMAFGRPAGADDAGARPLRHALDRLKAFGVEVYASAGNNGCDCPCVPACFTVHPSSPVSSVGAGRSGEDRDLFSNYGLWVDMWQNGANMVSTMPFTVDPRDIADGFAMWSGTSFSVAVAAGKRAQARVGA